MLAGVANDMQSLRGWCYPGMLDNILLPGVADDMLTGDMLACDMLAGVAGRT